MEAKNKSFCDSNYFVALFNASDSLYERALHTAQRIKRERIHLIISNLIFSEIVTVLSQKTGKRSALRAGRFLLEDPFLQIVLIDEFLQDQTWQIFQAVREKNISFVDCSIIAAMKAEGIRELLTFDHQDFKKLQNSHRFKFF